MSRQPVSRRSAPRFLHIIGVAKAGTTSLFRALATHPDVHGSRRKETDAFLDVAARSPAEQPEHLDLAGYRDRWWPGVDGGVLLTVSPYLFQPRRFAALLERSTPPDSRVLVILREPVARLVSAYRYGTIEGYNHSGQSLGEWVGTLVDRAETGRPPRPHEMFHGLRGSSYRRFLEPCVEVNGTRLAVVFTEGLDDPVGVCRRVGAWLGLSDAWDPTALSAVGHANRTRRPRSGMLHDAVNVAAARLRPLLEAAPGVRDGLRRLYWLVNEDRDRPARGGDAAEALDRARRYLTDANAGLADVLQGASVLAGGRPPAWVRHGASVAPGP